MENPQGGLAMPGFARVLSSQARWDLIDYLRAHSAGVSMRTSGKWLHPVAVPQFDAVCPDGRTIDLDDLRGRVLRIIAMSSEDRIPEMPPDGVDLTTILLARDGAVKPDRAACVVHEAEAWGAFAVLVGVSQDELAGTQIVVDRNGWLRACWRPSELADLGSLWAEIQNIARLPLPISAAGGHGHRH